MPEVKKKMLTIRIPQTLYDQILTKVPRTSKGKQDVSAWVRKILEMGVRL